MNAGTQALPATNAPNAPPQVVAPEQRKLRVFISYSRDDPDFADQVKAALDLYGFDCTIDRHGISGGEEWLRRLANLIGEADTVVFVLTPASAASKNCAWEVDEATRLAKRIIPIVWRPLTRVDEQGVTSEIDPPQALKARNYIYFYADPKSPGAGFGTGLAKLAGAFNTDIDWLREHTRYQQRALEWDAGGREDIRLLSGKDIDTAKLWAGRRPAGAPDLSTLQLDFLHASEDAADARLKDKQRELDEQRRLKELAEAREKTANDILSAATEIIGKHHKLFDPESRQQALAVFKRGADMGDKYAMGNLGWLLMEGAQNDYPAALPWLRKAADMGNEAGMNGLGVAFEKGKGVAQDFVQAREWYKKAAALGDGAAQDNLGSLYFNGQGVDKNNATARFWLETSHRPGQPARQTQS